MTGDYRTLAEVAARPLAQRWHMSNRADPAVRLLADRHYNRQKVGSPQFAPPGSCVVFLSDCGRAFWITSAPFAEYVMLIRFLHPGARC